MRGTVATTRRTLRGCANEWDGDLLNGKSLFQIAAATALAVLVAIATGADLTGRLLDKAMPGRLLHNATAILASVLAIVLAFLLARHKQRSLALRLALLTLVAGALGTPAWIAKAGPWLALLHSVSSHLLFALVTAAVVVVSPIWQLPPDPVPDTGWPSLRSLAVITPVFVVIQIVLGAAFRHQIMGVLAHIAGAIIVALLLLLTGMFVTQQCPNHKSLKPPAVAVMTLAFVQVFLGIGALTMRMMNNTYTIGVAGVTVAHVVVGALTLGANVVLALQIRRHVGA
jgi:hypothetical protein